MRKNAIIINLIIILSLLFCLVPINSAVPTYASEKTQLKAFSSLTIFGDSLSDVGNYKETNSYSYDGRYSNGKVWNEYLAEKLGVEVPKNSSGYTQGDSFSDGYNNFAHGGACSNDAVSYGNLIKTFNIDASKYSSYSSQEVLAITNIDLQIEDYNNINRSFKRYNYTFSDSDLVAVWGGANDLIVNPLLMLEFESVTTASERASKYMAENIETLIKEFGAKNILVLDLPNIGLTPAYKNQGQDEIKQATKYSQTFNNNFHKYVARLETKYQDVTFYKVDIYSIFENLINNYQDYGFISNTKSICSYHITGSEQSKYMFFDGIHPTTTLHEYLADVIYNQLCSEINLSSYKMTIKEKTANSTTIDISKYNLSSNNLKIEWISKTSAIKAEISNDNKQINITSSSSVDAGKYYFVVKNIDNLNITQSKVFYIEVENTTEEETTKEQTKKLSTFNLVSLCVDSSIVVAGSIIAIIYFAKKKKRK